MNRISESVKYVVNHSEHVTINQYALEAFADNISHDELQIPKLFEKNDALSLEQSIAFGFVYNAVNFSYWGEPKWTITIGVESYDGGLGMLQALQRGVESGYDLLSAEYLRTIPKLDLEKILEGNIEIPLFAERLELLRELGQFVTDNYGGSFIAIVEKADWDAVKLVEILADEIPEIFDDEVDYKDAKVKFYKRAQLVPSHLHELHRLGVSMRGVSNMDYLTALADYKVPQVLRKHGIIEYSSDLQDRIDNLVEIKPGSYEEVEIRAMTIWAVERLVRYLKKRIPTVNAIKINHILWLRGQEKSPNDKPYHRTRTIWY